MFFKTAKKTIINNDDLNRNFYKPTGRLKLNYTVKTYSNPENSFFEKADELRRKNMYKEAVANYLNAILIDRKNAESYYGLGVCYKNLKQYAKAVKYLTTASELNPESYEIYF